MQPGDLLHPIGVCDEVLYVPGRTRVQQIIPVGEDRTLLQETLAQHNRSGPLTSSPITRSILRPPDGI